MSHPPEPAGVIGPSMGTLNVSTQAPASWEQGLEDPSARPAGKPVQPPEMPPSFDVADADETGKIVAAGSGKAGWTIRLMSGTQALGVTTADERGDWVLIPDEPLAPGNHALSLLEIDPSSKRGISGQRSIILYVASRQTRGSEPSRKVTSNKN